MPEEKDPCVGERDLAALKDLIETRLEAMDRAQALFQENLVRVPTETQRAVGTLQSLMDEKFRSVEMQLSLRDKSVAETAALNATALSAALAASKEAVSEQNKSFSLSINKSELATTKLLDAQAEAMRTLGSVMADKLNDLKITQSLVAGGTAGKASLWGFAIGGIGVVISIVTVVLSLVAFVIRSAPK